MHHGIFAVSVDLGLGLGDVIVAMSSALID